MGLTEARAFLIQKIWCLDGARIAFEGPNLVRRKRIGESKMILFFSDRRGIVLRKNTVCFFTTGYNDVLGMICEQRSRLVSV